MQSRESEFLFFLERRMFGHRAESEKTFLAGKLMQIVKGKNCPYFEFENFYI